MKLKIFVIFVFVFLSIECVSHAGLLEYCEPGEAKRVCDWLAEQEETQCQYGPQDWPYGGGEGCINQFETRGHKFNEPYPGYTPKCIAFFQSNNMFTGCFDEQTTRVICIASPGEGGSVSMGGATGVIVEETTTGMGSLYGECSYDTRLGWEFLYWVGDTSNGTALATEGQTKTIIAQFIKSDCECTSWQECPTADHPYMDTACVNCMCVSYPNGEGDRCQGPEGCEPGHDCIDGDCVPKNLPDSPDDPVDCETISDCMSNDPCKRAVSCTPEGKCQYEVWDGPLSPDECQINCLTEGCPERECFDSKCEPVGDSWRCSYRPQYGPNCGCSEAWHCDDRDVCTDDVCLDGLCRHYDLGSECISGCEGSSDCPSDPDPCVETKCIAGECRYPTIPNCESVGGPWATDSTVDSGFNDLANRLDRILDELGASDFGEVVSAIEVANQGEVGVLNDLLAKNSELADIMEGMELEIDDGNIISAINNLDNSMGDRIVSSIGNLETLIEGQPTFDDSGIIGAIEGQPTFDDSGIIGAIEGQPTFDDSGIIGAIEGQPTFDDSGIIGAIEGQPTFDDSGIIGAIDLIPEYDDHGVIQAINDLPEFDDSGIIGAIEGQPEADYNEITSRLENLILAVENTGSNLTEGQIDQALSTGLVTIEGALHDIRDYSGDIETGLTLTRNEITQAIQDNSYDDADLLQAIQDNSYDDADLLQAIQDNSYDDADLLQAIQDNSYDDEFLKQSINDGFEGLTDEEIDTSAVTEFYGEYEVYLQDKREAVEGEVVQKINNMSNQDLFGGLINIDQSRANPTVCALIGGGFGEICFDFTNTITFFQVIGAGFNFICGVAGVFLMFKQ